MVSLIISFSTSIKVNPFFDLIKPPGSLEEHKKNVTLRYTQADQWGCLINDKKVIVIGVLLSCKVSFFKTLSKTL